MSNYEKKGHPVLGIVLGILGIAAALFLCLLTGWIGGAVALIFGVIALLLGIFAVKGGKKGGGIGSIVVGVLAIILAVAMTFTTIGGLTEMKKLATAEETPLMAKYMDNPSLGFLGIVLNIGKDLEGKDQAAQDDLANKLKAEYDILNKKLEELKK